MGADQSFAGRGLSPDALGPTITIGEILVEIMAVERGKGFLEPIGLTGPYASGAPAIFIDQCARAGGSAGIVACVGDDDFGRMNIERLARDGVDVSAIAIDRDYPTGSAFVRYRADGSRDFVFNIGKSAAARLSLTPQARALIARAGHIHIMGTAFAIPVVMAITDPSRLGWLLVWLIAPRAWSLARKVAVTRGPALNPLLGATAKLGLWYSLALAGGIILERWL